MQQNAETKHKKIYWAAIENFNFQMLPYDKTWSLLLNEIQKAKLWNCQLLILLLARINIPT